MREDAPGLPRAIGLIITLMQILRPLIIICLMTVAAAIVLGACGVGSDEKDEREVSCVPLSALRSYRFEARGVTEVQESPPPLASSGQAPPPFRLVIEVEAEAQGEERLSSVVRQGNEDGFSEGRQSIIVDDTVWRLTGETWQENERGPFEVPYLAVETCRAIAPDLVISGLSPTPDDVNGIASLHYQLELQNNFFARHINVGPTSDLARFIETVTVDLWIPEGANYPVKVEVKGEGKYPDGSRLIGEISYEMSDINSSDIDIQPPV